MRLVRVISLTDKGKTAINKHLSEYKNMNVAQKIQFKAFGYSQRICRDCPYTLEVEITNPILRETLLPANFIDIINKAMTKNGAEEKEDYKIEVV